MCMGVVREKKRNRMRAYFVYDKSGGRFVECEKERECFQWKRCQVLFIYRCFSHPHVHVYDYIYCMVVLI